MALVTPPKPKSTVEQTERGLEIVIPAKRNWFITAFLGFWLCGWLMGELTVPVKLWSAADLRSRDRLFLLAWSCLWTLGGGFAIYVFLWSLTGRERIVLTPSALSTKRELLGFGRLHEYALSHVRALRAYRDTNFANMYGPNRSLEFWGIGGGTIAFDYGAATVRFGAALSESEAQLVLERLTRANQSLVART